MQHSAPGSESSIKTILPATNMEEMQSLYANNEFRIYQDAIERMKNNEDQLPSLPTITLDIRRALGDPDVSQQSLAKLIARDPSLTAILMKHASSAIFCASEKPKNLQEVISRLGMSAIDKLVLSHSLKSLFVMKDPNLKELFKDAWRRQSLKACTSYFLCRKLKCCSPDDALVASLLSEVGTLAMLVALQNYDVPAKQTYQVLCRHYSKHLGAVLLAKWGLDRQFADILRFTGQWTKPLGDTLHLGDVINLALFHTIHYLNPSNDLVPLEETAAYQKLPLAFAPLNDAGLLKTVEDDMLSIEAMAQTFT